MVCLWISLMYLVFYLLFFWSNWHSGYSLTNNHINNILSLGIFIVPMLPLFWFVFIKKIWLRITAYAVYLCVLIPFATISSMAFFFTFFDVIDHNNNGYRAVFEKQLPDSTWLVIFRTPDDGALGGDHLCPALVQKIIPGLEKRKFLDEKAIILDNSSDSNFVYIDNQKFRVPKEAELRKHGTLDIKHVSLGK